jgi:2-methylcitrate dehydratase
VKDRLDQVERIELETQEAAIRIIDKTGPLTNYADRDHCLQYMVAVPLVFGRLVASDYSDAVAADPRLDALRDRMVVKENPRYTRDYFDPDKRYIGNSVQAFFNDGTATAKISIDYPIGHRKRRAEAIPLLMAKFEAAVRTKLPAANVETLLALAREPERLDALPVTAFMELLTGASFSKADSDLHQTRIF